jgi:HlyD family secretion protein
MRQKISAMLNPEQQKKYAEVVAAETGRGGGTTGRAYVVDDGKPREVVLRLGLTDGNATEVVGGALAEGTEVIVGNDAATAAAARPAASAPRLPF